jgi:hypothetical protein
VVLTRCATFTCFTTPSIFIDYLSLDRSAPSLSGL